MRVRKNILARRWPSITPRLSFYCPLEISPFPFKPYSQATPASLYILCPEVITMARAGSGSGPLWHHQPPSPALVPSLRCKGRPTHHEPLCPPSLLTMRTLKWFLFFPLCLSCGYAFMFSSLRDKAREPQGKVPCGGHFRIRQNLPEHAQGWLGSKWLWLFFVVVLYMMLKFRGDSEKDKVRMAPFFTPHWFHLRKLRLRGTHALVVTGKTVKYNEFEYRVPTSGPEKRWLTHFLMCP